MLFRRRERKRAYDTRQFRFLILIVFNALVGIFQEMRAKRTIDKLSLISAPKALVIRGGNRIEIAVKDIVLDDITVLSSGSQICADSFIVEGSVEVNESLITGEPDAILKNVGDKVMSGSFVVSGTAKAQVEHVGADNFATKISAGAKYFKKPNSEIWRSLMLIVKSDGVCHRAYGACVVLGQILCTGQSRKDGRNHHDSFRLSHPALSFNHRSRHGFATLIGMIPSGLGSTVVNRLCVA